MAKITISAIAAMARNRVIGKDNALIWHIPEDFKYFKRTTLGKPIIMGRKSFESLGKPLPGRPNIVISRSGHKEISPGKDGPFYVSSIDDALDLAEKKATELGQSEIFIIGGGEIYKQTFSRLDRLYLTIIHRDYEGDAFFPEFDSEKWHIIQEDRHEGDPSYTFYVMEPSC